MFHGRNQFSFSTCNLLYVFFLAFSWPQYFQSLLSLFPSLPLIWASLWWWMFDMTSAVNWLAFSLHLFPNTKMENRPSSLLYTKQPVISMAFVHDFVLNWIHSPQSRNYHYHMSKVCLICLSFTDTENWNWTMIFVYFSQCVYTLSCNMWYICLFILARKNLCTHSIS